MHIDIKNNNKLILDENNKINAYSKIKDFKKIYKTANKKRKKDTFTRIKNNKVKGYNFFKKYIVESIENFNKNYNEERILKIFNHAFTFEHENIEKELKDRIKIV